MKQTNGTNSELSKIFLTSCEQDDIATTVSKCIEEGVDVNVKTVDDDFALSIAVELNNMELFDLLLSHPKIDVNNKILDGFTISMIASSNHKFLSKLIVRGDIDLNMEFEC